MKGKIAATALILLLLTFVAEATLCTTPSQTYKGRCYRNTNCAAVCVTEEYTSGYCHGVVSRRCLCVKDCDGEGGGGGGGGGDGGDGGDGKGKAPPANEGSLDGGSRAFMSRAKRVGGHA
ncbi:hypothetical protein ACP70R_029692 [Stipagrostis hirtigluma subsp. patula]